MKTTLNKIREHDPCEESWGKLLKSLGKTKADDTEVSIEFILDLLGLDDALWALRAVDGYDREVRLLACDYAEHVLHIFEEGYPDDKRPRQAIEFARRYANGKAKRGSVRAAWDAAWDAAHDARRGAAYDAAYAAIVATWDAAYAAIVAARDATCGTAIVAARVAAYHAVKAAAKDTERQWQEEQLRNLLK